MSLVCYCDGGFKTSTKSDGYGSYKIYFDDHIIIERVKFDGIISSSSEVEYRTLISLLEYIIDVIGDYESSVTIYSDSKLMCNQLNSIWEIRSKKLIPFYQIALALLNEIQDWKLEWKPRKIIVQELGH